MSSAVIIKNLFDNDTYKKIIHYMNNHVIYQPTTIDNKVFNREQIHNETLFVKIHNNLATLASDIFKKKLKPSYCFLSMYKSGGQCPLHIDRSQCRYTIDYLIQSTEEVDWPIRISTEMSDEEREKIILNNQTMPNDIDSISKILENVQFETINLNPNDAVAYSGTHQWHYRPNKLNNTADLVFFHFVTEDFDGPLE